MGRFAGILLYRTGVKRGAVLFRHSDESTSALKFRSSISKSRKVMRSLELRPHTCHRCIGDVDALVQ
jgi:hypothetical protein